MIYSIEYVNTGDRVANIIIIGHNLVKIYIYFDTNFIY